MGAVESTDQCHFFPGSLFHSHSSLCLIFEGEQELCGSDETKVWKRTILSLRNLGKVGQLEVSGRKTWVTLTLENSPQWHGGEVCTVHRGSSGKLKAFCHIDKELRFSG